MTTDLPESIALSAAIRSDLPGYGSIVGGSDLDEQGRPVLGVGVSDVSGRRDIEGLHEGDTLEFAGATWQVTKIFKRIIREPIDDPDSSWSGPILGGGGSVAELTRVSEPGK